MNSALRLGRTLLTTAIALMAGLTLWAVQDAWGRLPPLERELTSGQLESFRLAAEFQQRMLAVENPRLNDTARRSPQAWTEFERAGTQLDEWRDAPTPKLSTSRERDRLNQLNSAHNDDLAAARRSGFCRRTYDGWRMPGPR